MATDNELLPMIRQSLVLLTLLAIISWFLIIWDSPPESFLPQDKSKTTASERVESYMTNVTSRRFSENGDELFLLTSTRMELFSGNSALRLSQPKFVSVTDEASKGGKKVSFAADWGLLSNDGTMFTLNGDARAFITGSKTQSELVSDQLNYDSRNLLIISKKAFTLMTPNSSLSGVGLKANLVNEIFTVTEKLKADHNAI